MYRGRKNEKERHLQVFCPAALNPHELHNAFSERFHDGYFAVHHPGG